jgi:uroporphyrinogen-III decarboxylase
VTEGTSRYLRAILSTGACDAVMFENAGACREMMGPYHLNHFVMPSQRRLLAQAREASPDVLLIEHNCSKTPYFKEILELDVDGVSVASGDVGKIRERGAERSPAWIGDVDNTRTMLEASPDEVEREARACIYRAGGAPFILSTSCEIPSKAPLDNIKALARAARTLR